MNEPIKVEFLPDGRMKIETPGIAAADHAAADAFIAFLKHAMGGEVVSEPIKPKYAEQQDHVQHTAKFEL